MRRKSVRNKRPVPVGSRPQLLALVIVLLACVALIAGIVFIGIGAFTDFNEYKSLWDAQNECIARLVKLGIERADIIRLGDSCIVGEG